MMATFSPATDVVSAIVMAVAVRLRFLVVELPGTAISAADSSD